MKRIFCDSNWDPEPSMPWTNRIGFCPKLDCAAEACDAVVRRSAAHASATVRTRHKYTTSSVYQIKVRRASVLIEPLEERGELVEHCCRGVQLRGRETTERLAPERLQGRAALLANGSAGIRQPRFDDPPIAVR